MNELPPEGADNEGDNNDGADELYRRASSREISRPSESVRRAVLRHAAARAADLAADPAADRAAANRPVDIDFKQPAANQAWRRPAAYGGLAAAALVGLLIAPRYLPPSPPPAEVAALGTPAPAAAPPAPSASPAAAPPAPSAPPAAPTAGADLARLQAGHAAAAQEARRDRIGGIASAGDRALAAKSSAQNTLRAESDDAREAMLAKDAAAPVASSARAIGGAQAARRMDSATALRQAASSGDLPRVRALLAEQPDIDARDPAGRTALMLAVLNGQAATVDALIASGADANAADSNGTTPLQAALAGNRSAIIDALRRAGAR